MPLTATPPPRAFGRLSHKAAFPGRLDETGSLGLSPASVENMTTASGAGVLVGHRHILYGRPLALIVLGAFVMNNAERVFTARSGAAVLPVYMSMPLGDY